MIVVIGRVTAGAGQRDELVRLGEEVAAAAREEDGCLGYRVYQATDDEDAFVFVEEWESREALSAHFRTDHIVRFMTAVPATLAAPPDVHFHDVSATRTLDDVG